MWIRKTAQECVLVHSYLCRNHNFGTFQFREYDFNSRVLSLRLSPYMSIKIKTLNSHQNQKESAFLQCAQTSNTNINNIAKKYHKLLLNKKVSMCTPVFFFSELSGQSHIVGITSTANRNRTYTNKYMTDREHVYIYVYVYTLKANKHSRSPKIHYPCPSPWLSRCVVFVFFSLRFTYSRSSLNGPTRKDADRCKEEVDVDEGQWSASFKCLQTAHSA